MSSNARRVAAACLMAVAATAAVDAQDVATSFDHLRTRVKAGDAVTVVDVSGRAIKGKVETLSATSLVLVMKGGRSTLAEGDVAAIRQRRRGDLGRGAKVGFAVGAGLGFLGALAAGDCDCARFGVAVPYAGAAGVVIGVAIGAATTHENVIFSRPRAMPATLTASPLVTRNRRGVLVSWVF